MQEYGDLMYSDDANAARYFFLRTTNDINFFVEDKDKEYEYEEIFDRMFEGKYRINSIFGVGGKEQLKDRFHEFGVCDPESNAINIYLADGDFDILLTPSAMIHNQNFIYLKAYNIETYYIDDYLIDYLNYYNEHKDKTFKEIVTIINTHINNDFYTNTMKTDTSLGKYVILNKYYYADDTYPSENLIKVDGKYHVNGTSFYLNEECYDAFLKMYNDAYNAGYGFKMKSAYRSYDTQVTTYNYWVSTENGDKTKADIYSARAGFSEHQTGYAFDIRDYNWEYEDYGKSESFKWVSENAHKYGFIIRFPKGKEHITGYQYESWHYRYCGIECATYIYENNITFEEYYEYFIKYNNPKNLS